MTRDEIEKLPTPTTEALIQIGEKGISLWDRKEVYRTLQSLERRLAAATHILGSHKLRLDVDGQETLSTLKQMEEDHA